MFDWVQFTTLEALVAGALLDWMFESATYLLNLIQKLRISQMPAPYF